MVSGSDEMREERRVVTALFADIAGSTAITEELDPEDARDLLGTAVARMIEPVDALGGTIKDLAGDGVLALFGAPIAHEDDAERAVLCGLRITDAIADYAIDVVERWGVAGFSVRVGIETGHAVIGPVGGGSRVEYGATGRCLNTASRLNEHADVGTVLVGPVTRRMVSDRFTWHETRSYAVKGLGKPVEAAGVHSYTPRRQRSTTTPYRPLIGRANQVQRLGSALEQGRGGEGGVVALVGDAGVGKSRLMEEAHRLFERLGDGTWLETAGTSYAASVPYSLYRNVVLSWLGLPLHIRRDEVRSAVETHADMLQGPHADALRGTLPILVGVGDVDVPAETAQQQLFAAVRGFLDGLAAERPVTLVLEDLQWSDPTSLALTESILELTAHRPLVLLLTTRADDAALAAIDRMRETVGERLVRMELTPLSREGDRALLNALIGGAELPFSLEKRLLDTTEGNPFFVEEQVRALFASGGLVDADGAVRFVGGSSATLAPTVERALIARIDRLADNDRRTLLAASVLGRKFEESLVRAVAEHDPRDSLLELERAEFVIADRAAPTSFRFRHALVQEAAYSSLLRRQRRQLHARAATALQSAYGGREEQIAATLGRHLAEAGETVSAVGYLSTAAREAAGTFSNEEAAVLAREAIALLGSTQAATSEADRPVVVELSRIEAAAMSALARYDEAVTALRRVLDLLSVDDRLERARTRAAIGQALADEHRYEEALGELELARRTIGDRPDDDATFEVWLDILFATGSVLYWLADYENHLQMLKRAEPLVEERATPQQRIAFYDAVRTALMRRDRWVISDEVMHLDVMVYEATRHDDSEEVRAWATFMHAITLMWHRDLAEAEPLLDETLLAAERLGSALLRSRVLTYQMVTARLRGDVEKASDLVSRVRDASHEAGLPEYDAMASVTDAWIAYRRGDESNVRQQAQRGLETWSAIPNHYPLVWMACIPLLAVAVRRDEVSEACRLAESMLSDEEQPLPPEIVVPFRAGLEAAAAGGAEEAIAQFRKSVTEAARLHYL